MFMKTSIALALVVAIASSAVAAPKHQNSGNAKITMQSNTPDSYRDGWFLDR